MSNNIEQPAAGVLTGHGAAQQGLNVSGEPESCSMAVLFADEVD